MFGLAAPLDAEVLFMTTIGALEGRPFFAALFCRAHRFCLSTQNADVLLHARAFLPDAARVCSFFVCVLIQNPPVSSNHDHRRRLRRALEQPPHEHVAAAAAAIITTTAAAVAHAQRGDAASAAARPLPASRASPSPTERTLQIKLAAISPPARALCGARLRAPLAPPCLCRFCHGRVHALQRHYSVYPSTGLQTPFHP